MSEPRIRPLDDADVPAEIRAVLGEGPLLNIFRTLAHHPKLLKRWLPFGTHVLVKSTLDPRERELVVLRTGWNCRSEYEFGQHTLMGLAAGLTEEEIQRVKRDTDEWAGTDRVLLEATDELCRDSTIADETWAALAAHLEERQLLDFVFLVGQYQLVSMALNSLRVELDDGVPGFGDTDRAQ